MSADGMHVIATFESVLKTVWNARFTKYALAFCGPPMAVHPRLGAFCPARELNPKLERLIGAHFIARYWASLPPETRFVFSDANTASA